MDDPILDYENDLYDFYVALGKETGKASAYPLQVAAINLFPEGVYDAAINTLVAPADIEEGEYGWVNYGSVDDTVDLTDEQLMAIVADCKSASLSPCCKAETFIEGGRRVCDKCRLSRPL